MSEQEAGNDRLDIDNMYLCGSKLTRVQLSDSEIRMAKLMRMVFDDVNMTELSIHNANMTDARISNVNMTGAVIEQATLKNLAIRDADLTGMTINGILVSDLLENWEKA